MSKRTVSQRAKKRMHWGATCKYSKGNRLLSCSPIPLAPHLARDWVTWNESDGSGEEDEEAATLLSIHKYRRKIFLGQRIPKTGLLPKRSESYCSSLNIRSLSVGSRNPSSIKSTEDDEYEPENSQNATQGFRTIFKTKRAVKPVQYQWVSTSTRQQSKSRKEKSTSLSLSVGVGSSTNLSTCRPNTAQTTRSNNVFSAIVPTSQRPKTSHTVGAKPTTAHHIDFHKSNAAYRTGRSGLKDFSVSNKSEQGSIQRDDLSKCVKMERMVAVTRCYSSPGRPPIPEPPAPSPRGP